MARIEIPPARTAAVRSSDATHNGRRKSRGDASSNNGAARTSSPRTIPSSPSRTTPSGNGQKIPREWEWEIIEFIKLWATRYFQPKIHAQIVETANGYIKWIRKAQETVEPVTQNWVKGLFKRHPDFKRWWDKDKDEHATTTTANPDDEEKRLRRFLEALSDCIDGEDISRPNTYVLSHTAYALAVGREIKATIPHAKKSKRQDPREMASVISAFACNGVRLSPYVIFKRTGKGPGSTNHSPSVRVHWNSTGWVDDSGVLFDWLEGTFERQTNPEGRTGADAPARLLLLDDEKFQISPEFFVACCSKNVSLFSFPRDSAKVFSPLEDAVTAVVNAKYGQYMSDKFHRSGGQRFRIDDSKFSKLMSDYLRAPELKVVAKTAWIESCLRPPDARRLSNLIRSDLHTPAPDSWGTPRVPRSASRPARPMQTPDTSGREQTADSDSDEPGDTSEVSGLDEWHDDGEEPASTPRSTEDAEEPAPAADSSEDDSLSSDEEEPVYEWKHPVDREDFVNFVQPFFNGECDARTQKRRDGLMAFFSVYQRLCQDYWAKCLSETSPRTPKKRSMMPKTPRSAKRRRS